MRNNNIIRDGDTIIKSYSASEYVANHLERHLAEYALWLNQLGLFTPTTEYKNDNFSFEMKQSYIDGRQPHTDDWTSLLSLLLDTNDYSVYGMDANPDNFIFNDNQTYFIDFYPVLTKRDPRLLREQFIYDVDEVVKRYFEAWNIVTCFLNRLRMTDELAFFECIALVRDEIIARLKDILPRDQRRLIHAMTDDSDTYKAYYHSSKSDTTPLTSTELTIAKVVLLEIDQPGTSLDYYGYQRRG